MAPTTHTTSQQLDHTARRRIVPAGSEERQLARLAARVRKAAADAGIELSQGDATRIAAAGVSRCDQIGVTGLGVGVVIYTVPEDPIEFPIVLGYADATGEWSLDHSHHNGEVSS
jgi:hypothetical protein